MRGDVKRDAATGGDMCGDTKRDAMGEAEASTASRRAIISVLGVQQKLLLRRADYNSW